MQMQLQYLVRDVREAFDKYEFHRAMRLIYEFCTVQASNVYLSAVKDRLYCEAADSPRRRGTQGVIRELLLTLVKLLAPVLPHTCEEAWEHIPHKPTDWPQSVHLTLLPEVNQQVLRMIEDLTPTATDDIIPSDEIIKPGPAWMWERLLDIRGEGLIKLEAIRSSGVKNPLDTELVLTAPAEKTNLTKFLNDYLSELEDMLGVGYARIVDGDAPEGKLVGIEVLDTREKYPRCERSWKRRPDVGSDPDYPDYRPWETELRDLEFEAFFDADRKSVV